MHVRGPVMKKIRSKPKETKSAVKPQRGHVHEHVLRYMCRGLMVGAFLPGQVMSLRKLAAGLGTSPMPVREVLSRLVAAKADFAEFRFDHTGIDGGNTQWRAQQVRVLESVNPGRLVVDEVEHQDGDQH